MEKIKVILDTDIGSDIDDAVALAYLLSQPRCDLVGITTVSGRPLERAQMASAICRNVGRDGIPIHCGCSQALLVDIMQKDAPQAAALPKWPHRADFPPNTAIDFLRQTIRANPGQIVLLAIGPMTNIGLLLATEPDIAGLLRGLVLMCGRFIETMGGEWNAVNDPHATAIVYGNGCQSRPPSHISYGLDVTMKCVMPANEVRKRFTAKALGPVRDFAEVWFKHSPHLYFHDPLAAASIFEPDLCTYRHGKVTISLTPPTLGWTVFRESSPNESADNKPHTIAATVDSKRFFEHYFDLVK